MNGDVDPLMALTERIDKALAAERIEFGPNALGILQRGGTVGLSGGERWSMALAAATVVKGEIADRQAAEARIAAAAALHRRDDSNPLGSWCGTCMTSWPCRTAAALGMGGV